MSSPHARNIFGTPSETDPWGFSLYGHHLCIAIAFVGPQMVISPTFFGAEPDVIDAGKHKGLTLFRGEELDGLRLMQSLKPELQKRAQLYPDVSPDDLAKLGIAETDRKTSCRCMANICQKHASIPLTRGTLPGHFATTGSSPSKVVQCPNFQLNRRKPSCNVYEISSNIYLTSP